MSDRSPRADLADVTLVAVTSVALRPTVEALRASMRQAQFGQALLFSDQPPPDDAGPEIGWRRIDRLESRADYSRFMLRELAGHIETGHVLCVQWDGFVLDGRAWDPRFLEFDYVGAVWPQFDDDHNVGNGGFSLRSRKLLEATRHLPIAGEQAEDLVIARHCRADLERQGIRFAPESVARRFAFERTPQTGDEFGFHGAFNLVRLVAPEQSLKLFRGLERSVLTRKERLELLRWAVGNGRWKLAIAILARMA